MSQFTTRQRNILLDPIQPERVQELDGISHLAAWDVIAHLNRVFGFEGWDKTILDLEPVYEHVGSREKPIWRNGRKTDETETVPACSVGYRCTMRLTVRNPDGEVVRVIEDAAMGTAKNQRDLGDAHDLAMKSAVSYALKRCAKDLGDQFGLSLYNAGQQTRCVQIVAPYLSDDEQHVDPEVNVQGDGISEGDAEFGDKRGERCDPVPGDGEGIGGKPEPQSEPESRPEPVREPEPAKAKSKPKPEATPPADKPEAPTVDEETADHWRATIAACGQVEDVKAVWREVQNSGALDTQTADTEGQVTTFRELMVARVNEIQGAGDAA